MEKLQTLEDVQHSDFIWTWKSNARGSKASLWLPYFSNVNKIPRSKLWHISYNGGELAIDLNQVDFIMFYGATGNLPLDFLDAVSQHRIVLMVHRRNQIFPLVFYSSNLSDNTDLLTKQILVREHAQKCAYVAKTLIRPRLQRFEKTIPIADTVYKNLSKSTSISQVRQIEANTTARYWKEWFDRLGVDEKRRSDGPVAAALDAGSKFIYGITLRWILFHKLSPCHGFLHEPTSYPALVYDLMEPYRYLIEDSVSEVWQDLNDKNIDDKKLVAATFSQLKKKLEEIVYVPATRQYVRRKNLLHGAVLALRAYLLNETMRLVLPTEGRKNGGRPVKIGYRLPGEVIK